MAKANGTGIWMGMIGEVRFSREKPGEAIYWNFNGQRGCVGDLPLADEVDTLADFVVRMADKPGPHNEQDITLRNRMLVEIRAAADTDTDEPPIVRELVTPDATLPPVATEALVPISKLDSALSDNEFRMIELALIDRSPFQTGLGRGDEEHDPEVMGLAASIREKGLAEPMIVRPTAGGRFELIAGHRRLAACLMIGRKAEKCIVRVLDDRTAEELHVLENLQRKDLTAIEEALSVERMLANGRTPEDVAKATGKSVRWVYRRASITKLTSGWKTAAGQFGLSAAFLEKVGRLPGEVQDEVLRSMAAEEELFKRGGDVAVLDDEIETSLRKLSAAPWMQFPACREICKGCLDRSDARPDLFEEMKDEPRCLNRACWDKKLSKFVSEITRQCKQKHGQVIEARSNSSHLYRSEADAHYSVPVVIVDGPKRGAVMWAPSKQAEAEQKGEPAAPKSKKESKKQAAARAYVWAVKTCVKDAKLPMFQSALPGTAPAVIPDRVVVAFALACGVNGREIIGGAYASPLQRAAEIHAILNDETSTLVAALWKASKDYLQMALSPDSPDIENVEKIARKTAELLNIPDDVIAGYVEEFSK